MRGSCNPAPGMPGNLFPGLKSRRSRSTARKASSQTNILLWLKRTIVKDPGVCETFVVREYWMTYRGPSFFVVEWFGSPPVSKLSLFLSLPACRRSSLSSLLAYWGGEGEGGGVRTKSYDREKAWSSINRSILFVCNRVLRNRFCLLWCLLLYSQIYPNFLKWNTVNKMVSN
jgi:hypothetical protein